MAFVCRSSFALSTNTLIVSYCIIHQLVGKYYDSSANNCAGDELTKFGATLSDIQVNNEKSEPAIVLLKC